MLVLGRRPDERVILEIDCKQIPKNSDSFKIEIIYKGKNEYNRSQSKIGFEAPEYVKIYRHEIYDKVIEERGLK